MDNLDLSLRISILPEIQFLSMKIAPVFSVALALLSLAAAFPLPADQIPSLRPPAVPLVTSDPYLSIWSEADHLTDDVTRHWTHSPHALVSLIRIDGKAYRLMGNDPADLPAFLQTALRVTPTRSIYDYDDSHVHVTLTFMTPALPDNLDILTRPATYLTWAVKSVDGKNHDVSIYDSTSSALAVNAPENAVTWGRETAGPLTALKSGAVIQTLFDPRGDDTRINWGYAYAAAPTAQAASAIGADATLIKSFTGGGALPAQDETPPRAVKDNEPVMAFVFNLGSVGADAVSRHLIVAYDELYEIKFSGEKLLPYWKRNGATMADLLQSAETDYPSLVQKCAAFDHDLMADMTKVGGEKYAQICALAYRQCLAADGIAADPNKQPLLFTKENTSNGDIATVDVIFPMAPIFVFLNPTLAKASVAPVLLYAASDRWKFPNAPHDLGTYPVATMTGEPGEQMVVEESGNMIILCDAIAQAEGNPDFSATWWPQLTQWAKYLEQYGLDPENQLCTDDFMGHLAHNSNLSVKAIVALAAYGDLCQRRGDAATAKRYSNLAKVDALHWMKSAADGGHYRLAFDKPGTWSQKYNLVWDHILGLNAFPPSVARDEIAYYKTQLQPYGLPLDSRTKTTKTDWTFWSATLAKDQAAFESIISPVYDYLNQTTARQPLADSYQTDRLDRGGMHARPVVGGLFIKMLTDDAVWKKWAKAGDSPVGPYAPLPDLPTLTPILPPGLKRSLVWQYTLVPPAADWNTTAFDDSTWLKGNADAWIPPKYDPKKDPKKITQVWIRTKVTLPDPIPANYQWILAGHGNGEIYVNGVRAGTVSNHGRPEPQEFYPEAKPLIQPGATLTIAAHLQDKNKPTGNILMGTSTGS
jgi:Domain of unknown function (DUF4965)/Domain of unknown function (DUF5127)/Domain of unknown function (DUF1793)/Domain of unknown function (DUF4964)